jgi:hypothetical protein
MRKARGEIPPICGIRTGTLADLHVGDGFDSILYIDVLEHIEADEAEVRLAARHLNPGGRLIVLAPAHQFLFSELDSALGHYRRYDRRSLQALMPHGVDLESCFYLDSIGVMANFANRIVLKSKIPTPAQIKFWDRFMVSLSKLIDPLLMYRFGKSIVVIWRKPPGPLQEQ